MARKVIEQLVDDITGDVIADGEGEAISFAVSGVEYVVDLNAKNAKKFHETMQFYIDHGNRVGGRKRSAGSGRNKEDLGAMREWLRANGHEVAERGRISSELKDLYNAAH